MSEENKCPICKKEQPDHYPMCDIALLTAENARLREELQTANQQLAEAQKRAECETNYPECTGKREEWSCEKCQKPVFVCEGCQEIIVPCECGHCPKGAIIVESN